MTATGLLRRSLFFLDESRLPDPFSAPPLTATAAPPHGLSCTCLFRSAPLFLARLCHSPSLPSAINIRGFYGSVTPRGCLSRAIAAISRPRTCILYPRCRGGRSWGALLKESSATLSTAYTPRPFLSCSSIFHFFPFSVSRL